MTETPRLPTVTPVPAAPAGLAQAPAPARTGSPAFEVLLERLTERASELETKSRSVTGPSELPEALDAARASLEDALRLGHELLEAVRAANLAGEAGA